jgi:hypothetical protein
VQQDFAANMATLALAGNCPFVRQHWMRGEAMAEIQQLRRTLATPFNGQPVNQL